MELKLGKMTSKEIAEWMGYKYTYYKNHIKDLLPQLDYFAKYEKIYGGVIIHQIYLSEFIPNINEDVNLYLTLVLQANENLTSLSGLVQELLEKKEFASMKESTLLYRVREAGKKAFGITKDPDSRGLFGSREYVWAIKLYDRPNHYRNLTEEEQEIFNKITEGFYATNPERIQKEALLERAFRDDESMSKEEYFKRKEELNLNTFGEVIKLFKIRTGFQIVHATAHDIDLQYRDSAF